MPVGGSGLQETRQESFLYIVERGCGGGGLGAVQIHTRKNQQNGHYEEELECNQLEVYIGSQNNLPDIQNPTAMFQFTHNFMKVHQKSVWIKKHLASEQGLWNVQCSVKAVTS